MIFEYPANQMFDSGDVLHKMFLTFCNDHHLVLKYKSDVSMAIAIFSDDVTCQLMDIFDVHPEED